ncbi:MAG: laccase domain-containing protein [Candidatus Paceibacterota bacterium]
MKIHTSLLSEGVDSNTIMAGTQVHGNKIVTIESGNEDIKECDGFITKNPHFKLGIRTADCAAICFNDGERIGIAHVGWRGLCAGMIENMFLHFNKDKTQIHVSPFLHSFRIQKDFCYDEIVKKFGEKFFKIIDNEIMFDFKQAIMSLLPATTVFDKRDTETDLSLPSYRRNGTKERIVTVISFD